MSGNGAAAGAGYGDMLVTSLLVLGLVCIVAFVAVRVLGRVLATGRARGAHLMDVVARVPLEPRRSLYVVEVAGKTLLVGTSEMGLSVLSELDAAEVRSRVAARPTFGELVKNAWAKRKGLGDRRSPRGARLSDADAKLDETTNTTLNDSDTTLSDTRATPNDARATPNDTRSTPNDTRSTPNDARATPNDTSATP